MMWLIRKIVFFLSIALGAGVALLALTPFVAHRGLWLCEGCFDSPDKAIQYYTVIAGLSAALLPVIGLYFGHVYFRNREVFERLIREQNRDRSIVELLLKYIEDYNECLLSMLCRDFNNENELHKLRRKAQELFDCVTSCFDSEQTKLIFPKEERLPFLELNSLVEKHHTFSHASLEAFTNHDFGDFGDNYRCRFRRVHQLCIKKLMMKTF